MVTNEKRTIVLGISAFYHDSAAALVIDGAIIAAAHEERFTRKKHDSAFPSQAIAYCLKEAGLLPSEVTHVVFYEKPLLKFERILETYLAVAPRGLQSFLVSMPLWLGGKLFVRSHFEKLLKSVGLMTPNQEVLFSEHHLSHAASAFFPSPFTNATVVTIDGVGEKATASIGKGVASSFEPLLEMQFPNSIGLLYSSFTHYLGFRVNSGEYKLMGLAPYGNPADSQVDTFVARIKESLVTIHDDGSTVLNQGYFNYQAGLTMTKDAKWNELFGFPRRVDTDEITQEHCNLALAIQRVTDEIVIAIVRHAVSQTGSRDVCLAGGVALNCVSNTKLLESGVCDRIWVQPAAGDAGGALGAALAVTHLYCDVPRTVSPSDAMQGSYLGPAYDEHDIETMVRSYGAIRTTYNSDQEVCDKAALLLAEGQVVGWMQGRMEWGPRALGARSILADGRNPDVQKKLNLKIKFREGFRPFAPAVLFEDVSTYFKTTLSSPYMLFVHDVQESLRKSLPADYHTRTWQEKLYYLRSTLPAITHLDWSARLQTVHKETNPLFHSLISSFKKKTGCSVIVNTSFNVRGEPIICTPDDAYRCFMRTDIDYLVIGRNIFKKEDQPAFTETETFIAD